jgi:hypothetical protein
VLGFADYKHAVLGTDVLQPLPDFELLLGGVFREPADSLALALDGLSASSVALFEQVRLTVFFK